jgi:hypothetical protein
MDGRTSQRFRFVSGALMAAATLGGCASLDGTTQQAQPLTWMAYLNGDDLRANCVKGAADHYRLVFNADYNQHIRTYDIASEPNFAGARIEARVIPATDLTRVDLQAPLNADHTQVSEMRLTARQFALFALRLYENGAFEPMRPELRLQSNGVRWLISGCRGGNWFFNAYPFPADSFAEAHLKEGMTRALIASGLAP